MSQALYTYPSDPAIDAFLSGKTDHSLLLFNTFLKAFAALGPIQLQATKTMIGISNGQHKIAWITQLGKNFLHVVFPFPIPYPDNLCFQKIAQVPGQQQYNHHLRLLDAGDINEEVIGFMQKAWQQ